ncbi:MAG: hypothetical protein WA771_06565 [Chthoniobacterales bacterium]
MKAPVEEKSFSRVESPPLTIPTLPTNKPPVPKLPTSSRLIWVIAVFLLLGSQFAHAWSDYQEIKCATEHADSDHNHHSPTGKDHHPPNGQENEQSTESHSCSHSHSHVDVIAFDELTRAASATLSSRLAVTDGIAPDSPVREIDYPPQLS